MRLMVSVERLVSTTSSGESRQQGMNRVDSGRSFSLRPTSHPV
jgi:hypothetical protein